MAHTLRPRGAGTDLGAGMARMGTGDCERALDLWASERNQSAQVPAPSVGTRFTALYGPTSRGWSYTASRTGRPQARQLCARAEVFQPLESGLGDRREPGSIRIRHQP